MAWMEKSVTQQRETFIQLARTEGANISELSRRFGISRKTAYKWLQRYDPQAGTASLQDHSKRPLHSPAKSSTELESTVLAVRKEHSAWGARKIARILLTEQNVHIAPSTVNAILQRHGCISEAASQAATPWQRFEHAAPNDLWQIDFKGHFAMSYQRCHALTALDDHSRYNLILKALEQETRFGVQSALIEAFECYGMPQRINADNGPPWGTNVRLSQRRPLTQLGVWLIRLGIKLSHSRPCHPQTNGKDERFHRTLNLEVIGPKQLQNMVHAQQEFDVWRQIYNHRRPHEALQMQTPAQRYQSSPRAYPSALPPIEYEAGDYVRKVDQNGWLSFKGRDIRVSKALYGCPVALRASHKSEQAWDVFFCSTRIAQIDLADASLK
ncbi:MAG: IS481 family transposase [Burkholderiaceae bacterium]